MVIFKLIEITQIKKEKQKLGVRVSEKFDHALSEVTDRDFWVVRFLILFAKDSETVELNQIKNFITYADNSHTDLKKIWHYKIT